MRRDESLVEHGRPPNPQAKSNWCSIFTFFYTVKIFRTGKRRDFDEGDLTQPLKEHKASLLGDKIAKLWAKELQRAKIHHEVPKFTGVILRCFLKHIIIFGIILFLMEIPFRLFQPIFLGLLVRYFNPVIRDRTESDSSPQYLARVYNYNSSSDAPINLSEAYLYASGIVITSLVNVLVVHPIFQGTMHVGMQLRIACCSLIYRKALRLTVVSMAGSAAGNVLNLVSNDVNRFDMTLLFMHYLWLAPLQMLVSLYIMYLEMDSAAVFGILAILIFIPLQAWFGNMTSVFRLKTALRTDERVRQMNEIVQGIQVIKMYTWEFAFADIIHKLRRQEIKYLKSMSYIRGCIISFIMFTTRLAVFLTVMAYILQGKRITAEKVFLVTSYYQILRQTMTVYFPNAIAQIAESNVAISRIKTFLMMPEADVGDPTLMNPFLTYNKNDETSLLGVKAKVEITNCFAKFGDVVCLQNINLTLKPGVLTAIIGHVGAGKSCILNLILGELRPFLGKISVEGVISYACQEPWLFAGTVRQNILFGRKYETSRYRQVVKVCALSRDFDLLPHGDRTIIGERGASLSGGQRARINLARAVYKRADIYLLDDPLSAVDTQVGKQLFDDCIGTFLREKVVVLVTHQLQYLQQVQQVVIMGETEIQAIGPYSSLQFADLNFAHLLKEQLPVDDASASSKDNNSAAAAQEKRVQDILKSVSLTSNLNMNVVDKEKNQFKVQEEEEIRTVGRIGCYVYKEYFKAGGNCCQRFLMVLLFLGAQIAASCSDYLIFRCMSPLLEPFQVLIQFLLRVSVEDSIDKHNLGFWKDISKHQYIFIYTGLIAATMLIALWRAFYFFSFCMRASINLHDRMFDSVIQASMKFFNTNTSGRILNRFSKDLGSIDEFLPSAMIDTTQIMLNLVGAIVIVGIVSPMLVIPTSIICGLFWLMRKYYLHTSRSVKRLEGVARSPVFGHLNASLQGLTTIRANGAEKQLTREFDNYQDLHSSAWFMFIATSRAFGLWLDVICTLYITIVTYSFFIQENTGSAVGLAITQCISLSGMFQWGLKQSAELENQMTSVERVLEFMRIEHEPDKESKPDKKPPPNWPKDGKIEFQNLELYYKPDDPPVLKNLTFVIEPKEKIGIVGRTGAGKSSVIGALFRLSPFDGQIVIDGIDTKQIGLHDLRRKISIIPQEPVLFSGTLRYNLDPFHEHDDESIIEALVDVEIKAALNEGIDCLDQEVSSGGSNISVGERQMVCLARAILRNNVILILDEATANVDAETDKFIQTTIRSKFSKCTVLTIAHRLHTIMDSDRVLVMDAGNAVEFDHPHKLLQRKNGFLASMVEKTGTGMAENLRKIAKESYASRINERPERP